MQFTLATLFTLAVVAMAVPNERLVERQVLVEAPAMTDKDGNIIPFDSEGVTQPNRDAGL